MTVSPLHRSAEPPAFDDFYRHFFVRVLVLVRRHFPGCDAEEIAQETMARCYTNYETLDGSRDLWPWVSLVARNAAIDSIRRNRRNVPSDELPDAPRDATDETYESVLVLERRRSVRTALKRLRPADRQLLEDHELEGIGYTEMAALRDVAPNALRQQLFRARNRLAVELRRTGASLGLVPVALQHKAGRLLRKVNDFSYAIGPAGASALSAAAVAGVATFSVVLGGPGAPVTAAAASVRTDVETVSAVERSANRAAFGRVAASRPHQPAVRPQVGPPINPPTTGIPVTFKRTGDPIGEPDKPSSQEIIIPTPIGDAHVGTEGGWTPGYGVLCYLGVATCPPPA